MDRLLRFGPVARLSLGLVALSLALLMTADWLFGFASNQEHYERQSRILLGENLASQLAVFIENADERSLGKTLQRVVLQNPEVLSIAIRQSNGVLLAHRGEHAQHWIPPETGFSTDNNIRIPLMGEKGHWGDIEISFSPKKPKTLLEWLSQPVTMMIAVISIGGFPIYYAYLRRAMHYLDPSNAVPERVSRAFDSFAEGLLVLDKERQIVFVNKAFGTLYGHPIETLIGAKVAELPWLQAAIADIERANLPWERTLNEQMTVNDLRMTLPIQGGASMELAVGSAPVMDDNGNTRGCLVTFQDLTELERANRELRVALAEIEESRSLIKAQNDKLLLLASRDPLTGCYNRRAFFDKMTDIYSQALRSNGHLCCIMTDIDHFKRFNDLYGHAVGDQVIRAVVRAIESQSRGGDILCRYGGEEFCLVLTDTTIEQGLAVAERMRTTIESTAGPSIRTTDVGTITSSFGLASITDGAPNIEQLIEQADDALYDSKKNGRNRVTLWQPKKDVAEIES
ncbi:MAG: diguanylate cyclase [Candidatus Accumulibacter sp.]|nr:diguanylate cyclase [Accumulibacter sp.]